MAEAEYLRECIRRSYAVEDDDEDLVGMSRGERAGEVERRREQCEALLRDYHRRCFKPRDPMTESEEAKERRKQAGRDMILDYRRIRNSSTMKDDDFSGMGEAERAAEADRRRRNALQEARRLQMEGHPLARSQEMLARILDFDPKQLGQYYNRLGLRDLDLDEESPLGPMRFTDKVYQNEADYIVCLCKALNFLSVNIASSDVGFPIHVYGTVIARDSLDYKCVYLFCRDRDHCQLINSKAESLILTGPKRGLALIDDDYVEIDLKIKDHQGQDRELSKGCITIRGIAARSSEKCTVESRSLSTRLSTMDVMYAVVSRAVEATIVVEVLWGDLYGEITAYTTSMEDSFALHDSKLAGAMTGSGKGVIQLMRSVISVPLEDTLHIVVWTGDGKSKRTIRFTPRVNCGEEHEIIVGVTKMRVMVTWSVIY